MSGPEPGRILGLMGQDDDRSQKKRMLAGDLYLANDPEIERDRHRAMGLCDAFNRTSSTEPRERMRILEELLGGLGPDVEIRPPFFCDYGYQTRIGAGSFANFGLVVLDVARVDIGARVFIGPYVQLLTAIHPIALEPRRQGWERADPIVIEDDVWLGGGVIVCPGVRIGAGTVVGAGAVVTRDLPAGVVAVGNPARILRGIAGDEAGE